MKVRIEPVNINRTEKANEVDFVQGGYILGTNGKCNVTVRFYKQADNEPAEPFYTESVMLPPELIAEWTDDEPLIDYILNQLELVRVVNTEE